MPFIYDLDLRQVDCGGNVKTTITDRESEQSITFLGVSRLDADIAYRKLWAGVLAIEGGKLVAKA